MKPSKYFSDSYESYYFTNYLPILSEKYNLSLPNHNEYINNIHQTKPKFMELFQKKYYSGCSRSSKYTANKNDINFYENAKKISKESIINFIKNTSLNIAKLSEYLKNTQKNKIYMLYKDGEFNIEYSNLNNHIIKSYIKNPKISSYIATTENGIKIKILLRWKNGNGIAFPSLQIS